MFSPLPFIDHNDLILPKTSVPPFTTAPPNRCNLFSLFSLWCFTLIIDCDGDAFGSKFDSELVVVDEFIDVEVKFLWKNASDDNSSGEKNK
jgi:hypothetical protein